MVVGNTPTECSTTSGSSLITNAIPLSIQDVHEEHLLDFTMSPEYAKDIYDHLVRQEVSTVSVL